MAAGADPEDVFAQLGFNALEAEVYVALLRHGEQTAYRLGKLLNRPTANVYKAVDALAAKGAVETDESDVRLCRAIPIGAVAKQLENEYRRKITTATAALGKVAAETKREGIYALQSVEAVVERAWEMLGRCTTLAVLDFFPGPLHRLLAEIRQLAASGKEVLVEAYEPIEIEGASVVVPAVSPLSLRYWQAQQLNLAVDGTEMLVALFNHDLSEIIQATYSNQLYLACMLYNGLLNEHKVHRFSQVTSLKELQALLANQKFFINSKVPGLQLLFEQYKKPG
ncbi:hypothetical protein BH24BAC1_BH24BAC1_13820 [soil metagenome]